MIKGCTRAKVRHAYILAAIKREGVQNLNAQHLRETDPRQCWHAVKCGRRIYGVKVVRDAIHAYITVFDPSQISIYGTGAADITFNARYLVTRQIVEHADEIAAAVDDLRRATRAAGIAADKVYIID